MLPISLHAGPLRLAFFPGEGSIRYLFAGGHEILRGISAPIRDQAWATVRPEISDLKVNQYENFFRVSFTAHCRDESVDFKWRGEIIGDPNGTLSFDFHGEALGDFHRNRIGFCVLHGAELSQATCLIEHTNGKAGSGRFPEFIQTGAPFSDIRAMIHHVTPELDAEVRLEGETFETEDQRNWTDASFKTYCTPLSLARPVLIEKGSQIRQRVTVRLIGKPPTLPSGFVFPWLAPAETTVTVGPDLAHPFPALGTIWNVADPTEETLATMRSFGFAHLRVEVWLNDPAYESTVRESVAAADKLNTAIEFALFVNDQPREQLTAFCGFLASLSKSPRVSRWLVFHEEKEATPAESVLVARDIFSKSPFSAPIGGGSPDNFAELNANPGVAKVADFTVHACNPQVHAFDPLSLIETLAMQGTTVLNAQRLSRGRPAAISPVTLTRRWRIADTGAPTGRPARVMPFQSDSCHASHFCAAWTVGSLASLAEAGATSITYFEAKGLNGLLFPTGNRQPVGNLFSALAPFAGAGVTGTVSAHPLSLAALALNHAGRRLMILANLQDAPQRASVRGAWGERTTGLKPYEIAVIDFP